GHQLGGEDQVHAGERGQRHDQVQPGADHVAGGHDRQRGADGDGAEPQQERVRGGHAAAPSAPAAAAAAASSLAGSPLGSCAGGGGTVAIHWPSRSFSCSRSRMSYSAYSNSGDQNSASNGHTSTQIPQYMHSE